MSDRSAFERDWRVPPGETVRAIMASRQMLDGDVSAQLDLTLEGLADLICGRIAIDLELADRLAEVFGPSSRFWLTRETLYRQPPQATPPGDLAGEQSAFIARLPVADMRKLGWIDAYDRTSRRDIVLRFFEDDHGDWRRNGRDLLEAVAFRTSPSHAADPAAVAAWLRQGLRQARSLARQETERLFSPACRTWSTIRRGDRLCQDTRWLSSERCNSFRALGRPNRAVELPLSIRRSLVHSFP
jgi:HTH-type transcriptional regulator/antitoxin HigA